MTQNSNAVANNTALPSDATLQVSVNFDSGVSPLVSSPSALTTSGEFSLALSPGSQISAVEDPAGVYTFSFDFPLQSGDGLYQLSVDANLVQDAASNRNPAASFFVFLGTLWSPA